MRSLNQAKAVVPSCEDSFDPDVNGDEEMEDPVDKDQDISVLDAKLLGLLTPNNDSKKVSYLPACGRRSSTKSWRADMRKDKAISTAKAVQL
ncbi:hypothetical protein MMC22_004579 [Lobaria immixta]|nr:hypothetical protein [Lobaria immixta]